jgi:uncharacterized protein YcbK (DUF882 family)
MRSGDQVAALAADPRGSNPERQRQGDFGVASRAFDRAGPDRRQFVTRALAGAGGLLLPWTNAEAAASPAARQLEFHNLHTGESLTALYWKQGHYVTGGLAEIDYVLRDFRTGDVHPIDPYLLDLVHGLRRAMDYAGAVHVISGYRSPKTNAMLAERSGKVAKNSYHVKGMAIDLRLPGRRLEDVWGAAMQLRGGGVGFYPESQFVHMDTGPVRAW